MRVLDGASGGGVEAEGLHHLVLVGFDRPRRQSEQARGDLLHALAFEDEAQDVALPRREVRLGQTAGAPAIRDP